MVNLTGRSRCCVGEKEVYSICRKCGAVRVYCSSASLSAGCRSLSGIRLPSFKTVYLYRTLCGMGDFFQEEDHQERNASLPDSDRSNDDFLDVYPNVQI